MTYTVDVSGNLKVIKKPPEELTKNWHDFQITMINDNTVHIELHDRTPWYPDVVAKMFVLGHYYKGKLRGHGEDHTHVTLAIPPLKQQIINASERRLLLNQYSTKDRFFYELKELGYTKFYPEWLESIPKRII